jgi:SAM-dependent methyltransferase
MGDCIPTGQALEATAVGAYFDGRATVYRSAASHGMWAWQRGREARAILAMAGQTAGLSALDLGCGAGFYAEMLAARGAQPVVAVDASAPMLAQISDPRIDTIVGDAATITIPRKFDLILVAGLLEFVADATAIMLNAERHLAEGGKIIVLVPPDNVAGKLYRRFHRGHGVTISLFSRPCLDTVAKNAGLRRLSWHLVWPFSLVCALEAR